jgi:hypothetical protein
VVKQKTQTPVLKITGAVEHATDVSLDRIGIAISNNDSHGNCFASCRWEYELENSIKQCLRGCRCGLPARNPEDNPLEALSVSRNAGRGACRPPQEAVQYSIDAYAPDWLALFIHILGRR